MTPTRTDRHPPRSPARRLLVAALLPLPAAADQPHWFGSRGSGRLATRNVDVSSFTGIDVGSDFVLTLRQAQPPRVVIETDDNLLDRIEPVVRAGTLTLDRRGGSSGATRLSISIDVWKLERLSISGSAQVNADALVSKALAVRVGGAGALRLRGLTAETVSVHVGGSGSLHAAGRANALELSVGGAGVVEADALDVLRVNVVIGGSGRASVSASESLSGSVGGSGLLRYRGSAEAAVSRGGAGQVRRI